MESDIFVFEKNAEDFIAAFRAVPKDALSYKPEGDDYTLGGLIVHVLDVMKKYSTVFDSIVDSSRPELIHSHHETSKQEDSWIREGIHDDKRTAFLKDVASLQKRFVERLKLLSEEQYRTKVPVIYENADDAYPTSPADILGWLKDHYVEHIVQVHKLMNDWKAQS